MKNTGNKADGNIVTGVCLEAAEVYYEDEYRDMTAERFIESAAYAPAGCGMELRIALPKEGRVSCTVLGDGGAGEEDYRWIFGSYVSRRDADPALFGTEPGKDGTSCFFRAEKDEKTSYSSDQISDLYNALRRVGAALILRLEKKEGKEIVCRARMDLKKPASLAVKTLLGSRLIRMETVPYSEKDENSPEEDRISLFCAERFAAMILDLAGQAAGEAAKREEERRLEESKGDLTEAEPSSAGKAAEWSGMIEDMEFSVRVYNSLRRAGYHTYEDIKDLTDDEIARIRNLGNKYVSTVREKIEEFRYLPVKRQDMPEKKDYGAMLDELIGLPSVKAQVRRICAMARMKKDMETKGMKSLPVSLHMGFLGNPGTAKTTAARILGGILFDAGILKSDQILEVGRADLVGRYTGETAQKVRHIFSCAEGRLLFIDEAYSLLDHWDGSYGDEAINTIVQEMENRRDSLVVVFAGYPDEMEEFFKRNPGLKSRVTFMIRFDDYKAEDLLAIARMEAGKRGFGLTTEAEERIGEICRAFMKEKDFGNGRFCRNLVESAILSYAERFYGEGSCGGSEADYILSGQDFSFPERKDCRRERRIGFC